MKVLEVLACLAWLLGALVAFFARTWDQRIPVAVALGDLGAFLFVLYPAWKAVSG